MSNLIFVFLDVILPIFIQILLGFFLSKKFKLDLQTLTKTQLYILTPALLFVKIYEAELNKNLLVSIVLHTVLLLISLLIISRITAYIFSFSKSMYGAFANSVSIYNSGNFCIPLIQLLYNNPLAFSIQIIVMMTHNFAVNTIGIFNASLGKRNFKNAVLEIFKVPMIYSVIIAFIFKNLEVSVWPPLWFSMDLLGQGLVPIALVTLGAQLATSRIKIKSLKPFLAIVMRLIISPILAFAFVVVMGISGMTAQVLVIAASAPASVSAIILSIEYKNEPEFCSQVVFLSTILSIITTSATIFLVTKYI